MSSGAVAGNLKSSDWLGFDCQGERLSGPGFFRNVKKGRARRKGHASGPAVGACPAGTSPANCVMVRIATVRNLGKSRMNDMLRVAALFLCVPAAAAGDDGATPFHGTPPSDTTECEISAWITKDAPAGLAVRAGPEPDFPALAAVPGPYSDGEETYYPEVTITGSRDGWFRISEIITDLYGGLSTDPVIAFSGQGWLPGHVLRVSVEANQLRIGPSDDAAIAFRFGEADDSETAHFRLDALNACEGFWVEVEGSYHEKRARGWTDDICASQVTTCP